MKLKQNLKEHGLSIVSGEENYVNRLNNINFTLEEAAKIQEAAEYVGVTSEFKKVIDTFNVPEGQTPAGFRIEFEVTSDKVLRANLVRDISYDKNGIKRPTNLLFSADSANPYEIAPIKDFIANLTCNPGILAISSILGMKSWKKLDAF